MNAPFLLAQANVTISTGPVGTPRVFRIAPPPDGGRVQIGIDAGQQARLDLTALANQPFALVRMGETLIIQFDDNSTVEIHPFFDRQSGPRADITIETAPGQVVSSAEFVALFPVTDDPSVLPAAGDATSSGFVFAAVTIDALGTPAPLPLLGSEAVQDAIAAQDSARILDTLTARLPDIEPPPPTDPPPPPFDDAPVAVSDAATVQEGAATPVNLLLLVDNSNSMFRTADGFGGGVTHWDVARDVLTDLLTVVNVSRVGMVSLGQSFGAVWEDYGTNTAQALVDLGSLGAGGVADYDVMWGLAVNALAQWSSDPQTAGPTLIYFVSDDGINSAQIPDWWETALQQYAVDASYAIGIGGGVDLSTLGSIAWPNDAAHATVVTDPDELGRLRDALPATLPAAIQGNVLTDGAVDDTFGADGPGPGAGIVSITIDGVVYSYDANLDQITSSNGTIPGGTLDVATAIGGRLTFRFAAGLGSDAGDYAYTPPTDVEAETAEVFRYVIADSDADLAEADLVITIQDSAEPAPIIERSSELLDSREEDELFGGIGSADGAGQTILGTLLAPTPSAINIVLEDAAHAGQTPVV